jgi:glycosyltransferase involved in cell wall biosynthesis
VAFVTHPPSDAAPPPGVLFVLPWNPDNPGGVTQVAINLFRSFAARGDVRPRVLVNLYPAHRPRRLDTLSLGPVDQMFLPLPPGASGNGARTAISGAFRMPVAVARLAAYLRRTKVRAIAVHYPSLTCIVVALARRLADPRIRIALCFHGQDLETLRGGGAFRRRLWRWAVRDCDAVVACSESLGRDVAQAFPAFAHKIRAVHNGVDAEACRAAAGRAAVPAPLDGKRYIATVAAFEEKKAHDVLLAAFREVAREFPDLCLALVGGTGPTLASVRRAATDPALRGRVVMFADLPHEQTLAAIAGAELLVLPSRREPFGIVLLEAGSLGVPVVASRVGGIPEIVEDGASGRLVAPDDAGALARAIAELLGDRAEAARLATNLRRAAETRFTWRRAADRYAAILGLAPAGEPARADGVETAAT